MDFQGIDSLKLPKESIEAFDEKVGSIFPNFNCRDHCNGLEERRPAKILDTVIQVRVFAYLAGTYSK